MNVLRTAALAALMGAALPGFAAPDTILAQATSTLSDLRYRLEDLDPDDGITPWVRFQDGASMVMTFRPNSPSNSLDFTLPGGVDAPVNGQFGSPDGRGLMTRDGRDFEAVATVRVRDVGQDQTASSYVAGSFDSSWYVEAGTPSDQAQAWRFILSPNTRVVVEGTVKAQSTIDLSPLLGDPRLVGDNPSLARILVGATPSVKLGVLDPLFIESDGEWRIASLVATADKDGWATLPPDPIFSFPPSFEQAWSFHLDNATPEERTKAISFQLHSQVLVRTTPVPEPGAGWLVLAGGVAAGCAARARRKSRPAQG